MSTPLQDRTVYVVGVGTHPYHRPDGRTYVSMGLDAMRSALSDAQAAWLDLDALHVGSGKIGMAAAPTLARFLGRTGLPVVQVESASASGSVAFRQAVLDVAGGTADLAMAVGVDKAEFPPDAVGKAEIAGLADGLVEFTTMFALKTQRFLHERSASVEDLAQVAVKNHANGALNPFAQRQKARTLEEVLAPPFISGPLTRLQCTPVGEGAAAVVVASEEGLRRIGVARSRCVKVLSSVHMSEPLRGQAPVDDGAASRAASRAAYEEAGVGPDDVDVVELHDAFTVEEPVYLEAMGICRPGEALADLGRGDLDIGGRIAVSPSGGLLAMGHPVGPTGIGQVSEVVRQLRAEAEGRQHPGARTALTQMVGVGGVCTIHLLQSAAARD